MNDVVVLSEDQHDCLQEIVNVAMGQAGDSLARFLEVFMHLSVPRIRLVDAEDLPQTLTDMVGHSDLISAVRQGFYTAGDGNGLRGEAIVLFGDTSFRELAELLAYEDDLDAQAESELLLDVTNVLNGACLNGIAEQIDTELAFSPPSVLGQHIPAKEVIAQDNLLWMQALLIEIHYTLENRSFNCNLMMLMPGDAIEVMKYAIDKLLEDI